MSTPGTIFLPLSNPTSRSGYSCSLGHDLSHDILRSDPQEDSKQDSIKCLIEKRIQGLQGRTLLARDKSVMSRTVFDIKNTLAYPRDITPPWYVCSRPWVRAFGVQCIPSDVGGAAKSQALSLCPIPRSTTTLGASTILRTHRCRRVFTVSFLSAIGKCQSLAAFLSSLHAT